MSVNIDSKIMWIDVGELNVRRLFHRMKNIRNPGVQLINYIPPSLWERKKKLDIKLKAEKNINSDFHYIVKVGKNDLLLLTKINGKTYWEEDDISKFTEDQDEEQDHTRKRKQSPTGKSSPKRFIKSSNISTQSSSSQFPSVQSPSLSGKIL